MSCDALLNLTNGTNSTFGASDDDGRTFEPSTPLCLALSAFGGLLEVTSTMCLAYPEFKKKKGEWK